MWTISKWPLQRFSLLSGALFQADPSRLQIFVSDAVGDDGMGYYFGALGSDAPEYRAAPWDARCSFGSSHTGELSALDHFPHRPQIFNCLLLWATDSESGMHSVNSKAVDGLALLESSLAICDPRQIVLLAFWVPGEHNRVADFLSHLSHIHRSEVAGRFTPAQTHTLSGAATGELGPDAFAALAAATLVPIRRALQVFDPAVGNRFVQECTGQVSARPLVCGLRGVGEPPCFPSVRSVRGPIPDPLRARDGGSVKSLSSVLTALRQESTLQMFPWLLPGAELSISRLVSQLKFEDTGDTLRKAPLQEHHLQSLLPLCNLDDAHDLLMVTILYIGNDGLLRSGEIVQGWVLGVRP